MRPVQFVSLAALCLSLGACASTTPGVPAAPLADHHQHLFSEPIRALSGPNGPGSITASDLVGMLDKAGIERALVLSPAYMFGKPGRLVENEYAKVRAENDWNAAQANVYPKRLRAMCGVNPLAPYALEELARCSSAPGFARGMKLHFGNSDVQLDNPDHLARMKAFFSAANRQGMALVMHTRASISLKRPYGAEQARLMIEELIPMAPDVVIHIAHMAGTGPGYVDPPAHEVMAVLAEAFEKRDPRLRNVWVDVASIADARLSPANAQLMVRRIRQVGVDHILYGSDAATSGNMKPAEAWQAFRTLPLTEAEFATIANNVAPYMR
jgi:predicted TIM-barrel fold metal-dependent hydrolase